MVKFACSAAGSPVFRWFKSWARTWHCSSNHTEAVSHMPQLEGPTTKNVQLCIGGLWGEKGKNKIIKKNNSEGGLSWWRSTFIIKWYDFVIIHWTYQYLNWAWIVLVTKIRRIQFYWQIANRKSKCFPLISSNDGWGWGGYFQNWFERAVWRKRRARCRAEVKAWMLVGYLGCVSELVFTWKIGAESH